jgi:hypothetical protein
MKVMGFFYVWRLRGGADKYTFYCLVARLLKQAVMGS